MTSHTDSHISLSDRAKKLIGVADDLKFASNEDFDYIFRAIRDLPITERTGVWETLQATIPPEDFAMLHRHYVLKVLQKGWASGRVFELPCDGILQDGVIEYTCPACGKSQKFTPVCNLSPPTVIELVTTCCEHRVIVKIRRVVTS